MKTASRLIIISLAVGLMAVLMSICKGKGDAVKPQHSADYYEVEKLFTVDGITVYRFFDGYYVYFTNKTGVVSHTYRSGKINHEQQTICNGD